MDVINYTIKDVVVDRDDYVKNISDKIRNATFSQAHIVFSETGFGKSFLTKKIEQNFLFSNFRVIRVVSMPRNNDNYVNEGYFLDLIFELMIKYFKKEQHKKYCFESYIVSGHNMLIEKMATEELINDLFSSENKNGLLKNLVKYETKRKFKLGSFNPQLLIDDSSPITRSVKSDYIKYIFENIQILLIIENIQIIDNISLKYLLDWISDTKSKKHIFILEYTISDTHKEEDKKLLQKALSLTGAEVFETQLMKMPSEFIAEVIDSQLDDYPSDIHFTIDAQKHYENISNGNLWDLMDYARIYEKYDDMGVESEPTLLILNSITTGAKYFVSILACHSGNINENLMKYLWFNYFSDEHIFYESICREVIDNHIVKVLHNTESDILTISHSSILDVWQNNITSFSSINRDTYRRLENFYKDNYNKVSSLVNKEKSWQMLVRIYTTIYPEKIKDLLDDFKNNVIKTISRKNTWNYLKILIEATNNNTNKFLTTYFQILKICYSASLFSEGYSCIEMMEQAICIEENDELLLNKILFLSILDKHEEAINIYEAKIQSEITNIHTLIKLKLLILNSFIVLGNRKKCYEIDNELKHIKGFRKTQEYALYLRLTNIYKKPVSALIDSKRSIKHFHKMGESIQEGKSYITYSKLLSSIGKHHKAISAITKAKLLLADTNEGLSCIYNNLAGYLLLSGKYGTDVWDYLDIAEIYSVSTYDKLSVIINKLAWCYENSSFNKLSLLESQALELIDLEPSPLHKCNALYNLYVTMKKAGNEESANNYYLKASALKDKCSYVKARIDGITWKTRYIKPRIKKPYHICYLSYWVFDI